MIFICTWGLYLYPSLSFHLRDNINTAWGTIASVLVRKGNKKKPGAGENKIQLKRTTVIRGIIISEEKKNGSANIVYSTIHKTPPNIKKKEKKNAPIYRVPYPAIDNPTLQYFSFYSTLLDVLGHLAIYLKPQY